MNLKIKTSTQSFFSNSSLLLLANATGSLLGYSYHLMVSYLGGKDVYADLGLFLSILNVVSVISMTLQMKTAEQTITMNQQGLSKNIWLSLVLKKIVILSILAGFLLVFLQKPFLLFFKIRGTETVYILGLCFIILFVVSVIRGVLQGEQRFALLSLLRVLEPLVQLMVGSTLVYYGFRGLGALLGTVFGLLMVLVFSLYFVSLSKESTSSEKLETKGTSLTSPYWSYFLFILCLNTFLNIDVLTVKHFFWHQDAAEYIAASFMGRFLTTCSLTIGVVLFPKALVSHYSPSNHSSDLSILMKAIGYFLVIGIPFLLVGYFFSNVVVGIFFGAQYSKTENLMFPLILFNLLVGISYLIGLFSLSLGKKLSWFPLAGGLLLFVFLVMNFEKSISSVATYTALGGVFSLTLSLILMIPKKHKK